MAKIENRGGIRANSGAKEKPKGEVKIPVTFYIETEVVETVTVEACRSEAIAAVRRNYRKRIKNILK